MPNALLLGRQWLANAWAPCRLFVVLRKPAAHRTVHQVQILAHLAYAQVLLSDRERPAIPPSNLMRQA